jgi:hypothetical protein
MKLIPQPALDCFPLSDEAFSQWNDKTDLLQFLYELHDFPVTMLAQDGTTVTSSARHVGIMFYGWGKKVFLL